MIGSNLAVACRARGWTVFGTYNSTPVSIDGCEVGHLALDDPSRVASLVAEKKPDVIINCAASVNLSGLEVDDALVSSNVAVTRSALAAAEHQGCLFVQVSSDWVFSGDLTTGSCYTEFDPRAPVNAYGRTKAKCEELVEVSLVPHLITRPANVYGLNMSLPSDRSEIEKHIWSRSSLALRLLNDLRLGRQVLGPESIYQSPTSAWSYAVRTCDLIDAGAHGVVNTAGPKAMSRLAYLREFALAFDMDVDLVHRSSSSEMLKSQGESVTLPLPPNTSLCDERLAGLVGPTFSTAAGFETLRDQLEEALQRHGLK
jgi:dTDP-4-dehydrorhamnose reductase